MKQKNLIQPDKHWLLYLLSIPSDLGKDDFFDQLRLLLRIKGATAPRIQLSAMP